MSKLIREFAERRIWQILVVYPGVTFGLLEAAGFFVDNYGVDRRVLTATLLGSVTVFPAALLWNWRHGKVGKQPIVRGELVVYGLILALTLAVQGRYWGTSPQAAPRVAEGSSPLIAVLPFTNDGADEVQYLADGITESLANWLATVPEVRVLSQSTARRLQEEWGDERGGLVQMGVQSVLSGRLAVRGDQVIVSASLENVAEEETLWGERLTRPLSEAIALEQAIVSALRSSLRLTMTSATDDALASGGTDDPEAYRHYLRGHHQLSTTDLAGLQAGVDELRLAIQRDPTFALPYADIASALAQLAYFGHVDEYERLAGEARTAALAAVAQGPRVPQAHTAMADVHQLVNFDFAAADASYAEAVDLAPSSPDPFTRFSDYLWYTGRYDQGRVLAEQALAIDPLDGNALHARGINALFAGEYEAAVEAWADWNRFAPANVWSYAKLGVALAHADQCDESLRKGEEGVRLSGQDATLLYASWIAWADHACSRMERYAGFAERAEEHLEEVPESVDAGLIYYFAMEEDADAMVQLLERIVAARSPLTGAVGTLLTQRMGWVVGEVMKTDPRYRELLTRIDHPALRLFDGL